MSAPDTNIDTQTKRHRPSLVGIAAVVFFAGALLLGLLMWLSANGNTPEDTGPQVAVTPGLGADLEE